jgi:Cu2+-exporting ATPase
VILTLVLLTTLSTPNQWSERMLKLAPTEATLVIDGADKVISIHDIKRDLLVSNPEINSCGWENYRWRKIDESMISGRIPVNKKAMIL